MDARAATDVCSLSVRRSRVVLTPRCWRQVAEGSSPAQVFPLPCMLVCTFVSANRTRDRGCSKHPVFPVPSDKEGANEHANLGRSAPRECETISIRHCERSEAIHVAAQRKNGLLRG